MLCLVNLKKPISVVRMADSLVYKTKGLVGRWEPNGFFATTQVLWGDGKSLSSEIKPPAQIRLQPNDPLIRSIQNLMADEPKQT